MRYTKVICITVFILLNLSFIGEDNYVVEGFNESLDKEWRGRFKNYEEIYTIAKEGENTFLQAHSEGSANFIIKRIDVDLVEYPFLNWRWRAKTLPQQGDESVKKYCDVSASIALVVNRSRIIPKSIKYSWSTTLDKGTYTKSPFAKWPARCDIHVMESGADNLGQWVEEKVNVLEDYKMFYKKENVKSKKVRAIVILTDSDNTNSPSQADYDDIYFSKS